jgi:eukaryotic-like serine/threonine-protein kinase
VSKRAALRGALPYIVVMGLGFALAYAIVAFFVFPSGIVPQDEAVPNVVGMEYRAAETELVQAGFRAERGEERFHSSAPRLVVLEQTPAPGSRELTGTMVRLVISAGQRMGTVPNVVGMTREQAEVVLSTAGHDIGETEERPSRQPRGEILETRPTAGTQAPMPSPVVLVISSGPALILVPDLTGRTLAEAQRLIEQIGLTVGRVHAEGGMGPAIVVNQLPFPGTQVEAGTRIDLTVLGEP